MTPSCFRETLLQTQAIGDGGEVRFTNNGVLSDRLVEITTYSYNRNTIVEVNWHNAFYIKKKMTEINYLISESYLKRFANNST